MKIEFTFNFKSKSIELFPDIINLMKIKNVGFDMFNHVSVWIDQHDWLVWEIGDIQYKFKNKSDTKKWQGFYNDDQNKFLKQKLLPGMTDIVITSIEGTYGKFNEGTSEEMFANYNEEKKKWEDQISCQCPNLKSYLLCVRLNDIRKPTFSDACEFMYDSSFFERKTEGD